MDEFIAGHQDKITGPLSGFDRLVLRGTLRGLSYQDAMRHYLYANDVLLKDFGTHVEQVSEKLEKASEREARQLGRPGESLAASQTSKEDIARAIANKDVIREGLVCVLRCVEPCQTFDIHRNREAKKLELVGRQRKCVFIYHYWIDPRFGFMSARIQSWFPFSIQICLNGREWLARQMDGKGIK